MSDKSIAEVLQENFKCAHCGLCCAHGGQIKITPAEAQRIADYLDIDMGDMSLFPFAAQSDDPDYLYLEVCDPCFFWNKVDSTCMIHEVKPAMCRDYPWVCFVKGDCALIHAMVCPNVERDILRLLKLPVMV